MAMEVEGDTRIGIAPDQVIPRIERLLDEVSASRGVRHAVIGAADGRRARQGLVATRG